MAGRSVAVASDVARAVRAEQLRSGWSFNLYSDAFEGGGSWQGPRRVPVLRSGPNGPLDPERSAREAARRARGRVRRYVVANRCNRLLTLTYRGEGNHDRGLFVEHMHGFWRRLRDRLGTGDFPYLWVPEWHPGGHGLHGHASLASYVPQRLIAECWPHGFVSIKRLSGVGVGRSSSAVVKQARSCAGYLGKYVGKAFEDERRPLGAHRYEVGQGFQPRAVKLTGSTRDEVVGLAIESMGGEVPSRVWDSPEDADFNAVWLGWSA